MRDAPSALPPVASVGAGDLRLTARRGVRAIVLGYALIAGLWILLSDRLVGLLFRTPATLILVSSLKGLAFVLITSFLLLLTLDRYARVLVAKDERIRSEEGRNLEELRASENKFSTVFHLSPDAIDLTDLETGISLDVNQSYEKLYGFSREELIGHSTLPGGTGLWMTREDRDRHVAELKAHGVALGCEVRMRRKGGGTFLALISSSVVDIRGEACNISMARDITARKRGEEALRESNQRLELAAASGQLGIWDRDLVEGTEVWNPRM